MSTSTTSTATESTKPIAKSTTPVRSKAKSAPTKPKSVAPQAEVATQKPKAAVKSKQSKGAAPVAAAPISASPTEKESKSKKPKMVRDSFTIPKTEYAVLQDLKERSNKLSSPAKKTELLRAGIKALSGLNDEEFLKAIQAVPSIKTGRPSKNNAE